MTQQHPITPPSELYAQWCSCGNVTESLNRAAQWGADQELEACLEWMKKMGYWGEDGKAISKLRAARRPKPSSLKEQSVALLDKIQAAKEGWDISELDIIRRALEQLP